MAITKWNLIINMANSNRVLIGLTWLSGIAYNVSTILIPISIGKFYELAFGFSSHKLKAFHFLPYMDTTDYSTFLVVFFGLVSLRFLFEFSNRYGISLVGERFAKSLREELFEAQMKIAIPIYEQKGIGKYLLRFSSDLTSIQNYIKNGILRFAQDLLLLGVVFMVVAFIDFSIAILILGFMVFATSLLWMVNKVLHEQSLERRNQKSGILSFVNTRLMGIASLKAFNKYNPESKRFRKRSERLYQIGKKYIGTTSLIQASIPAMTYALLGAIMFYALHTSAYPNALGGSSLLVIILLILGILPVLRRTLRVSIVWKLGSISFDKFIKILELPKEHEPSFGKIPLNDRPLMVKNVSYKHDSNQGYVFKNLNIEIKPKTTTQFYGPSGCGKSTLIKLLLKSVFPENGELSLGGFPYSLLSEKSIRQQITIVSKDYPLYGKDVFEAVTYSRNKARKDRAAELLQNLQQYEKPKDQLQLSDAIGDLGGNLNSGQKKLVMYCRAFLTKKPIIIIEEPFDCLSPQTAALVLKMIQKMRRQKTFIVLSQAIVPNLETDQIYALNQDPTLHQTV